MQGHKSFNMQHNMTDATIAQITCSWSSNKNNPELASTIQVQEKADLLAKTPQHNALGTDRKDSTAHVRFCTPAAEPTKTPKTPVHSRSSNAGE